MDFKTQLTEFKTYFESRLIEYFSEVKKKYSKKSEFIDVFVEIVEDYTTRGGKRLRPALVYYAYKLFKGEEKKAEVIKFSIFIEILQTFLLIHDDIIDRSSTRRGKPTVHKIFEEFSEKNKFKDDYHFGNTMAILAGDFACQLGYQIIAESNFEEVKKNQITKMVAEEITNVCFGQVHDVLLNYDYKNNDDFKKDIEFVNIYKTAIYTFKLPILAGSILANAEKENLENLVRFSYPVGIAFQIRDDILSTFGDPKETGKDIKSDIQEGKKTILIYYAYQNAKKEQKEILDKFLGKKNLTDHEFSLVQEIIASTGALKKAINECEELVKESKKYLSKINNYNQEAYDFISQLADYIIVRNI